MFLESKALTLTVMFALALAPKMTLAAQTTSEPEQSGHVAITGEIALQPKAGAMIGMRTEGLDAAPLKGSPFCATVTSEHTQMFADGNRIHTTENSTLCRDNEGRTRREAQLNLLGAVQQNTAQKIITIVDPVAGFRYTLDTTAKVARRMPLPKGRISMAAAAKAGGQNVVFYARTGGAGGPGGPPPGAATFTTKVPPDSGESAPSSESLGDQTFGGIHATGTRVTTSIPAGSMGNDQPISVVSESWYSPELKATVMTKHSDPWAGQLTTQFTNVSASEPDASLFTVPSDYKVVDEKAEPFMIKVQGSPPPPAR
jgi:hypothetical protein